MSLCGAECILPLSEIGGRNAERVCCRGRRSRRKAEKMQSPCKSHITDSGCSAYHKEGKLFAQLQPCHAQQATKLVPLCPSLTATSVRRSSKRIAIPLLSVDEQPR